MKFSKTILIFLLLLAPFATSAELYGAQPEEKPQENPTANDDTYIIGAGDVLAITVWREPSISGEYPVRPDGKITFPLINDIKAQGLTPLKMKEELEKRLKDFIANPIVTVGVQEVNSKNIFILGKVNQPGKYPLLNPTTVLQAIAQAGGLAEWAEGDEIVILRTEGGKQKKLEFDYDEVAKGKRLEQNIFLKPGDTIIVP
jgi:polysaccharide export outer membrane protein